jgi:ubiquitin carboxyl-terminal hydrolase 5/13
MKKLAINEEREEDKYEHTTVFKCWKCDLQGGKEVAIDVANASIPTCCLSDQHH